MLQLNSYCSGFGFFFIVFKVGNLEVLSFEELIRWQLCEIWLSFTHYELKVPTEWNFIKTFFVAVLVYLSLCLVVGLEDNKEMACLGLAWQEVFFVAFLFFQDMLLKKFLLAPKLIPNEQLDVLLLLCQITDRLIKYPSTGRSVSCAFLVLLRFQVRVQMHYRRKRIEKKSTIMYKF